MTFFSFRFILLKLSDQTVPSMRHTIKDSLIQCRCTVDVVMTSQQCQDSDNLFGHVMLLVRNNILNLIYGKQCIPNGGFLLL